MHHDEADLEPYRYHRSAPDDLTPLPASAEVMQHHLVRHRERCGLGPALVLRCECGAVEVLCCSDCCTALLLTTGGGPLCKHGRLLVLGGLAWWTDQ